MVDNKELKDEELEKVSGGNTSDNPKGLMPGDNVFFKNEQGGSIWMWGRFVSYVEITDEYIIEWNEQTLTNGIVNLGIMSAGFDYVKSENIL